MLTPDVLKTFAQLDTHVQVKALRRCGVETEAADKVLGHLAGMYPERYSALTTALEAVGR